MESFHAFLEIIGLAQAAIAIPFELDRNREGCIFGIVEQLFGRTLRNGSEGTKLVYQGSPYAFSPDAQIPYLDAAIAQHLLPGQTKRGPPLEGRTGRQVVRVTGDQADLLRGKVVPGEELNQDIAE